MESFLIVSQNAQLLHYTAILLVASTYVSLLED